MVTNKIGPESSFRSCSEFSFQNEVVRFPGDTKRITLNDDQKKPRDFNVSELHGNVVDPVISVQHLDEYGGELERPTRKEKPSTSISTIGNPVSHFPPSSYFSDKE